MTHQIITFFTRLYYRRLYTRLLFHFIKRNDGGAPVCLAEEAFKSITGRDYKEAMGF